MPASRGVRRRLAAVAFALWAGACSGPDGGTTPRTADATRDVGAMAVRLEARAPDRGTADRALEAGFAEAERLAALLLAERPASEIDVLNRVPMRLEIELSQDTAAAVALALDLASRSGGAYDPTARTPLRKVWGLESGSPRVPRPFELESALRAVDWTDLELGAGGHSARRYARFTRVDLGPVALGAVLDGAAAAMAREGASAGRAGTAGGLGRIEVAFGAGTRPWTLELDTPAGRVRAALADGALATGVRGPVHRTPDGTSIREPFDPRSGRPVEDCEWSAVRAPTGAEAGGAAAALLVLGRDGPDWLAGQPRLEGAVVLADRSRLVSPAAGLSFADRVD